MEPKPKSTEDIKQEAELSILRAADAMGCMGMAADELQDLNKILKEILEEMEELPENISDAAIPEPGFRRMAISFQSRLLQRRQSSTNGTFQRVLERFDESRQLFDMHTEGMDQAVAEAAGIDEVPEEYKERWRRRQLAVYELSVDAAQRAGDEVEDWTEMGRRLHNAYVELVNLIDTLGRVE